VRGDALALFSASGKILTSGPFFSTYQNLAKADPWGLALAMNMPSPASQSRIWLISETLEMQRLHNGRLPLRLNLTE
jgi:hypothetical protein